MDGLVAFSSAPLQAATLLGFGAALAAGAYLGFGILSRIFQGPIVPGWASLVAAVIGMGGIQLVVLGVIGEYIGRIYDETKGRPVYVVSDARNVAREGAAPPLGLKVGPLETGAAPGDPDRRQ
jgi:dolichol-phosphate mannosyltransferase